METKFKPFDKVLVRDAERLSWHIDFFSNYCANTKFPYCCMDSNVKYCIPFEGNEHLLGTTDDYVEPFEPKDGDFVTLTNPSFDGSKWVMIFMDKNKVDKCYVCYANILIRHSDVVNFEFSMDLCADEGDIINPSTEEEKRMLLDALHEEGKDWDEEKKKIIDYKWKPKEGETFYFSTLINAEFAPFKAEWDSDIMNGELVKKGWVFKTREECQALCDKLNEAIKNVK